MEKAVTRRKWTTGLIIAGAAALVITFWSLIMSMLSLLAVAGVLTLLSLPLCKALEKRLPSGAAAAIALLTLLGAVLGMLWGLIPPLLRQSAQLMSRLPALLDSLRELLARWSAALEARGIPLGDMQAELFSRISAAAGQLATTLVSGIRRLTGSVSQWLLAPLLSFYFLRDRKRLCLLLSLVLPVKYRARGIRAAREMRRESALYLRGHLSALILSNSFRSSVAETGCLQKRRLKSFNCSSLVKSFPPSSRTRRVCVRAPSPGNSIVMTILDVITKTFI